VPYGFVLDFGSFTHRKVDLAFMTHHHSDHCQKFPQVMNRDRSREKKVYVPDSAAPILINFQKSVYCLDHPEFLNKSINEFCDFLNFRMFPVLPGTVILEKDINSKCSIKHVPFDVEILQAYHTVDSVGYGFIENKKIMKQEIKDKMTDDNKQNGLIMKEIREQNIETHEIIRVPRFAFFCDSNIWNLLKQDEWKKYPAVICECTGLICDCKGLARHCKYFQRDHTCINVLLPIMRQHMDKRWILIHVSMSLDLTQINTVQDQLIEEGFDVSIVADRR
jgi:ribonuclease BN (tRNA processing enzyme)